jgi:hypothetical protein
MIADDNPPSTSSSSSVVVLIAIISLSETSIGNFSVRVVECYNRFFVMGEKQNFITKLNEQQ